MRYIKTLSAVTLVIATSQSPCLAGTVQLPGIGSNYNIEVTSYKEARFSSVIKQQYDFSCGSAAIATLLSFHYSDSVSEREVFDAMYQYGDKEKIASQGFSMLDMKHYLDGRGYRSDGFRLSLDKLEKSAGVPAIAILNSNGYNHFVVIKGVKEKEVLLADPATGMRVMNRDSFEKNWNGLAFIIRNKTESGRLFYNLDDDWKVRNTAPFGTALNRHDLGQFSLSLPTSMDF